VIFAGFGFDAGFLAPTDSLGTRKWPQGQKRFIGKPAWLTQVSSPPLEIPL
jgi:hypothetical protein